MENVENVDKEATERYQRGWDKLKEVDGVAGEHVIESLSGIAPELGQYIIEFAFGDIYSREGLDLKQRQLVTLASLTTQGGYEQHFMSV